MKHEITFVGELSDNLSQFTITVRLFANLFGKSSGSSPTGIIGGRGHLESPSSAHGEDACHATDWVVRSFWVGRRYASTEMTHVCASDVSSITQIRSEISQLTLILGLCVFYLLLSDSKQHQQQQIRPIFDPVGVMKVAFFFICMAIVLHIIFGTIHPRDNAV
jgi:hypothetical protein